MAGVDKGFDWAAAVGYVDPEEQLGMGTAIPRTRSTSITSASSSSSYGTTSPTDNLDRSTP